MKEFFLRIRHNTGMKIVALIFAVLIWSYVITTTDPLRTSRVRNVPIELVGAEVLAENDLTIRGDLSKIFANTSVDVELKVSDMNRLTADNVTVIADVSQITHKGTYTITLQARTTVGVSATPQQTEVEIEVDDKEARTIPLSVAFTGTLSEDLYKEEAVTSLENVVVTGAKTDLDQVSRAVCRVDLSKVNDSVHEVMPILLLDAQGNEIDTALFAMDNSSATVRMEVLAKKTVPIDATLEKCFSDPQNVGRGKQIASLRFNQNEVVIVGPSEVVEKITSVNIKLLRLGGIKTSRTYTVELDLPEEVRLLTTNPIQLTVEVVDQ